MLMQIILDLRQCYRQFLTNLIADKDYQFNLLLDQLYKKLLNEQNNKQVNGMLVIEIIPKDQSTNLVQIPKNDDKIEAYGAWVTDNPHGWNELHPAWKIRIL